MMKTKIFMYFLFLLVLVPLVYRFPDFIIIKEIRCSSQFGGCRSDLSKNIGLLNGKPLRDVNREIALILEKDSYIEEYNTQLKLPNILLLNVVSKKSIYALKDGENSLFALVDKSGFVLSHNSETNLPKLIINGEFPEVGSIVDEKQLFASELLYRTSSVYKVGRSEISDNKLVIELVGAPDIIFPTEGDIDLLLGSMVILVSKLNSDDEVFRIGETQSVSSIDLRFKNPVLK